VHYGKDPNFVIADRVQQTVGEVPKWLAPNVASNHLRGFGESKDVLQGLLYSQEESFT